MRTAGARIVAALAVLLVALPANGLGQNQYFCRMMGRLLDACCCKAEESKSHAEPRSSTPEIKAPGCCQLVQRGGREAAPGLRDSALRLESPLVATLPALYLVIAEPGLGALAFQSARARAPPPARRSIFLTNCSLLT